MYFFLLNLKSILVVLTALDLIILDMDLFSGGSMVNEHSELGQQRKQLVRLLWQQLEQQQRQLCGRVAHGERLH